MRLEERVIIIHRLSLVQFLSRCLSKSSLTDEGIASGVSSLRDRAETFDPFCCSPLKFIIQLQIIYATFVITKSLWNRSVVRRVRSFRSRFEYKATVVIRKFIRSAL